MKWCHTEAPMRHLFRASVDRLSDRRRPQAQAFAMASKPSDHKFSFSSRLLELLRNERKHRPPQECHEIGVELQGLKPPYGSTSKPTWLQALIEQLPEDVPKPGQDRLT